jgi:pyrroline-5-carboxylate reductase
MESSETPAKLRENVTSKKGTTAEALRVMQEHDFMGMMDEAIQAAYDRNQVLATELDKAA